LSFELDVVLWNERHARRCRRNACLLHGFEHSFVGRGLSGNFPVVTVVIQVLSTSFKDDIHQVVLFGCALGNDNVALLVEQIRDGAGGSHVAAILAKDVPNFAHGAVAVVGVDIQQNGNAARPVTFKSKLFVRCAG
jgi:hypothetical protein